MLEKSNMRINPSARHCAAVAVLAIAVTSATGRAVAGEPDPIAHLAEIQQAFVTLGERFAPSVVAIRSFRRLSTLQRGRQFTPADESRPDRPRDRLVPAAGSGVIIRADGRILTNEHVVQGAETVKVVLHDGRVFNATAVHSDPRSDLAVVQIEATDLTPAPLGDLSRVRRGHWAIAMGNPYGYSQDGHSAMSYGIVSAVGRYLPELDLSQRRYYGNLIQTDAEINPGNSGGPLLNIQGEVIGINTAISTRSGSSDGVGFAVPISTRTRTIIDTLLSGQTVAYGYLGVWVETASSSRLGTEHGGALVNRVDAQTPAARAGLRRGDRIVAFDGNAIRTGDALVRLAGATAAGRPVVLRYYRGLGSHTIRVTLDQRNLGPAQPVRLVFDWRGMKIGAVDHARRKRFRLADATTGLVVTSVDDDSPAAKAGIRAGQVIEAIEQQPVSLLDKLRALLRARPGPVSLQIEGKPVIIAPVK